MKICSKCETINADRAQFCKKCGSPLASKANTQQSQHYSNQSAQGSYQQQTHYQPATQQQGHYQPYSCQGSCMTFSKAVSICMKQKYACFNGRASRAEFWYFYLFEVLTLIAVGIVFAILGAMSGDSDVAVGAMVIGMGLGSLVLFCPMLGVGIRRLHDTGKSGWWYLISCVPYIGSLVLLIFFCLAGEQHENDYGPVTVY